MLVSAALRAVPVSKWNGFYLSCEQSPVMGLRGTNHGGLVGQASRARGQKANLG